MNLPRGRRLEPGRAHGAGRMVDIEEDRAGDLHRNRRLELAVPRAGKILTEEFLELVTHRLDLSFRRTADRQARYLNVEELRRLSGCCAEDTVEVVVRLFLGGVQICTYKHIVL